MNIQKEYLRSTFLINMARTIPHAVLTVILINDKGMSLSQIMIIQLFFSCAVFLLEVPSGILADNYKRKKQFLLAIMAYLIAYTIIYFSSQFLTLGIAWFIYGCGSALYSGTIDGYIVSNIRNESDDEKSLKNFLLRRQRIELYAAIVGVLIGNALYQVVGTKIYILSCVIYLISLIYTFVSIKIPEDESKKITYKEFKRLLIGELKTLIMLKDFKQSTLILIGQISILQIYIQTFYQLWQVLYLNHKLSVNLLGAIYIYHIVTILVANKLSLKIKLSKELLSVICLSGIFVSSLISLQILNGLSFLLIFPISLLMYNILNNYLFIEYNKQIDIDKSSSHLSFISTCMRIVTVLLLIVLSVEAKFINPNLIMLTNILIMVIIYYFYQFSLLKRK